MYEYFLSQTYFIEIEVKRKKIDPDELKAEMLAGETEEDARKRLNIIKSSRIDAKRKQLNKILVD